MKKTPKFTVVRLRLNSDVVIQARVPLQNDPMFDRENVAAVRAQLEHYRRTGRFVGTGPMWSEPPITTPEFGITVTLVDAHPVGVRPSQRKAVTRG